jgi:flavin-binding protein dodecin
MLALSDERAAYFRAAFIVSTSLPFWSNPMSVAKVIELNSSSTKSIEDAVQSGLTKCAESVKNIKGAWVNEIKVVTGNDGSIEEWRVNLRVTFIVK